MQIVVYLFGLHVSACYPTDVRAKLSCISEDDMTALAEQKDWKSTLKYIVKHIPFKKFL